MRCPSDIDDLNRYFSQYQTEIGAILVLSRLSILMVNVLVSMRPVSRWRKVMVTKGDQGETETAATAGRRATRSRASTVSAFSSSWPAWGRYVAVARPGAHRRRARQTGLRRH